MGIESNFAFGTVSEYVICQICLGIFDDPLECQPCGHIFCRSCAELWFEQNAHCPIDRNHVTQKLRPSGIIPKLLSRISLKCEYFENGCFEILKVDDFMKHIKSCEYGPDGELKCKKGCDCKIKRKDIEMHDCRTHLTQLITAHQGKLYTQKQPLRCCDESVENLKFEWKQMCNFLYMKHKIDMEPQKISHALPTAVHQCFQNWSVKLPLVKKTMWEKILARPGSTLQNSLKIALVACRCPEPFLEMLLNNSTERHWPFGIRNLYVRKENIKILNSFILRKIPEMQAVVMDFHQNEHVSLEFRAYPGLVFIFECGVE